MSVRTFRDADARAVVALWKRAGIDRPWLHLAAEIREKRTRDRSLFLVAVEDGAIVGAVMGAYDGRRGWVYHLATERRQQREGIGAALMAELERGMKRRGVAKVNLQVRHDNREVVRFYSSIGYRDARLTSMEKWLR